MKHAFQDYFKNPEVCEAFDFFKAFLPKYTDPLTNYKFVSTVDMINFTDFIDLSKVMSIYSKD